jgi:radical SAM protein with 4Fe4S-binding SPASM domain
MVYKVKLHDKDTFLQHRLEQESKISETMDSTNPLTSILTIELSTTELCNRTCVFCPRHDPKVYPNRNLHMSVEDAEMISKNIGSDFKGKISLTGFSENFLNKNFHDIIKVMRKNLSNSIFECNTNGDFLTGEYAKKLFINGLDLLYINLYDGLEQIEKFTKIMKNAKIDESKYSFRAHYSQEDYGLKINNRGGNITWLGFDESDIESLKGTPCYYPFYKMFIDYNGDVLLCCNDWGKEIRVGNMIKNKLEDVWLGDKIKTVRDKLTVGDRNHSPCNKCSVNGQLFGKKSFDLINEYYRSIDK